MTTGLGEGKLNSHQLLGLGKCRQYDTEQE